MPNRIIKETIRTSKSVNSLTDFQFRVWIHLITFVDDFGRGVADPELVRNLCFPRRKGLTDEQIEETLGILASKGMISLYENDGESYFYFPKWSDHQRIQTKQSKYPAPPEIVGSHGDPPLPTVTHGDPPPESNPIQSNKNTNPNPNPNPNTNTKENPKRARARESTPKDDGFERFWDAYPKKSGDIRQAYQEYVFALDSISAEDLLKAIQDQTAGLSDDDLRYFQSADKWLRNRAWRNRPKAAKPQRTFTPTSFE